MVRCLMLIYGRLGHLRPPECSDANTEKGAARYGNPFRWRGLRFPLKIPKTGSRRGTRHVVLSTPRAKRTTNLTLHFITTLTNRHFFYFMITKLVTFITAKSTFCSNNYRSYQKNGTRTIKIGQFVRFILFTKKKSNDITKG
jgi:hypothetical protein